MGDPVFNVDNWDPFFPISDDMTVDSKGRFKVRISDNMAMDMDTGEMHFTTPWAESDESDED